MDLFKKIVAYNILAILLGFIIMGLVLSEEVRMYFITIIIGLGGLVLISWAIEEVFGL